ncbi:Chitin binding Peritrophin-A domain [Popillia japonica]|uniref:Chitin binding Peritrophin-A domain n=1 Tax=Popillia japonica TaxID=7064 RepID=A0AAW1JD01_POPJA
MLGDSRWQLKPQRLWLEDSGDVLSRLLQDLIECPENGIHFVQHPKTCSKFVKCDNGLYQEINCREGHWFDLKRGLCDDMNNVECTIEENPSKIQCPGKGDYFLPHPTNCDQFVQCTDGNYIIANCHDGLHFNPAVGWCQDPSIAGCLEEDNKHLIECPENGIYFVQHPKTCSKFVKCNNGLYKEINCREGHWFDPKRGLCDDMNNVECTIEENPSKIQCPGKGDYFLPHPTNCNQFVQCTDGNYIIANCHDGLHFNPALGWCQDPSIAGCLEEDNKPLFECPGDSQMFFPHPTSCSDFIECNLGEYRVLSCGPDLHWNPAAGHCDAPENANCEELPPVTEAPEGLFECPGDSQMFFPHPTSCSDFIECNLGEYRVLSCGPDLHWNPAAGHCDAPENANCEELPPVTEAPENSQMFFPHPTSCSYFIECNLGEYRVLSCGPDLHWNTAAGHCDAPENANCEELPPVTEAPEGLFECPGDSQMFFPHPTSCSYFIECNLGEYRVLSCGPDHHWNTSAKAPEGLFECPGDSQMFFPHPTSCSHFIECNLGEYRVLSCGPDHHWNTAAGHCDAPENANCEELPPVTEAPEENANCEELPPVTEAPEGLFECPGDSHMFFPHPTSCSHFIECKLGTYRVLYCGTDLHWNAAAGHCDLPINANCEEFPSVTEDPEGIFECPGDSHMFFPHPTSCSHFIECKLGEYKVFPCERDLHWNAAAGHCDRPENANCKELPPIPDKEPPLLVCPEATQKFFPHPNNCSLFIECNFGEYSVLECTEDLHWNDATGYCDFPRYANCEVFPPDTEEESDQIDCPGDTQKFFPHPTNCSLFIECNFGRYSVLRCMKDFHWNDAAGHCDFQENANCEVQPPTTEEQPALLECPGDTQKFFPHPSNCSLFIECNFGRYSVLECMKDFHWNEAVGHCDFPKNANCEQLPPVTEESPGSLLECPDDTQMFFAHPTNCSLFIECNFGVYRVLQCMKDFHWNDHVGHCDFQENTNCDRSNGTGPEPFACPGDTQKFFPHPTNCSLFIECNFAEYRILQCMKDFHWNEIAGHCDFPDNANCEVAATDPPASTTDSTSGETTILETTGTSTIETSSSRTDSTISTTWTDRPILSTSTPPSSSPGAIATESTVDSSTTTTDMSTETSSETTTDMPIGSTTNKGSETDGSTGTTWTDKPN